MRYTVCICFCANIFIKECALIPSKINIAENKAHLPRQVRFIFMERITGIEPA